MAGEKEPFGDAINPAAQAKSRGSERALDATAFFLADVADGLGPFLVIDLTSRRGWSASQAGLAMAMLLVGTVAMQTFTGSWIDRTRHKTMAIAMACCIVAAATVGLYFSTTPSIVYGLQALTGVMVTVFPPALAAISLGLVGRNRLAARIGRNEACFHAGNVTAAFLAIATNYLWGTIGIFCSVAAMAIASAVSAHFIDNSQIDHELARGADDGGGSPSILPWRSVATDQRIQWFVLAVVLFHFANAAMLPLVGQKVGHSNQNAAQSMMAICIIVAQIVMVPIAFLASHFAILGRRKVFLVGFLILPIRGLLYTLTDSPSCLIAIQVLDGIGAGIFGVVAVLMVADLTRGTGRFNFAQGLMATAIGLGAAASQFLAGIVVDRLGFDAGFLFLSGIAVLAVAVFLFKVPETSPHLRRTASLTDGRLPD
ncbi:MAG TPA: MFS transporter [Pirellulales bacterium]|jgi:MFS family permease